MLVFWQSLLSSFKSYLVEAKKKEKLIKLNSSLKSFNASLSRMRLSPASLTSVAAVALFPILLTSWMIVYNLFQSQQFGSNQNISAMGSTHTGTAPYSGIYLEVGSIFTGKYGNGHFKLLSREEMESLKNARSKHSNANTKDCNRRIKITK